MAGKTVTGPIALIKVNGITVGKIRDIRATETFARGEVRGLGNTNAQEVPILSHSGTFSIDAFLIDLKSSGVKKLMKREVVSPEQFRNTYLLSEDGIDIYIYKKIPKTVDDTSGLVTAIDEKPVAILRRCFLDSESFNISEGQISTHSQTGRFLDEIIFMPQ